MTPSAFTGSDDAELARTKDKAHARWLKRRAQSNRQQADHAAWSKNGLPKTYDVDQKDAEAIKTATLPD